MKEIATIILIVCCLFPAHSQQIKVGKVSQAGGKGWDVVTDITQLSDGQILLTGAFYDKIVFQNDTLVSKGSRDIFIAGYKADGTFEKAISLGGSGYDYIKKIIPIRQNGFILPIQFNRELQVGDRKFHGKYLNNILVTGFDKMMTMTGYSVMGSNNKTELTDLATSPDSGCYITGWYADTLFTEGIPYLSKGGTEAYLGKVSGAGKLNWIKSYEGEGNDIQASLAVCTDGNIYMTGLTSKGCFGDRKAPQTKKDGSQYLYISQSDQTGNTGEVSYPLSGQSVEPVKIIRDSSAIWILANFRYSVKIGNTEVTCRGGSDIILIKRDVNSKLISFYQVGGTGNEKAVGMVKSGEQILLSGSFSGKLDFGDERIEVSKHGSNTFVATFTSECQPSDILSLGNEEGSFPCALIATQKGIYLAGEFRGKFEIGETTLQSAGKEDIYLARIINCGAKNPLNITYKHTVDSKKDSQWELDAGSGFKEYSWDNDASVSRYMVTDQPGTHSVTVTDDNGCVYTGELTLTSTKSATITNEEEAQSGFRLYPTLTGGLVYWEPSSSWVNEKATLRIYDASGKLFSQKKISALMNATYSIDFSGNTEGIYVIEISGNGFREVSRVVVKK